MYEAGPDSCCILYAAWSTIPAGRGRQRRQRRRRRRGLRIRIQVEAQEGWVCYTLRACSLGVAYSNGCCSLDDCRRQVAPAGAKRGALAIVCSATWPAKVYRRLYLQRWSECWTVEGQRLVRVAGRPARAQRIEYRGGTSIRSSSRTGRGCSMPAPIVFDRMQNTTKYITVRF
jgi:hypothetical protein